jgi:transposase-like protein
MVVDHRPEHPSQWAAIRSVGEKLGIRTESLRRWVRQAERDAGQRPGLTTSEREELHRLQRENGELRRANEILKKAPHISPKRGSTAERSDGRLYRRPSGREHWTSGGWHSSAHRHAPIWTTKPATGRRLKQRIRVVLDWAKASGHRSGDNPVHGVTLVLPRHKGDKAHHPALLDAEVPGFLSVVRSADATSATKLAFEFLILTAARTSEVLATRWEEPAGRRSTSRRRRPSCPHSG